MVVFFAFLGELEAIGKMEEFQDKIRLWNLSLLYFLFDVDIVSVSSRSFMLLLCDRMVSREDDAYL